MDVAQRIRKYLILQNVIHWVKSIAISRKDIGHCHNSGRHCSKTLQANWGGGERFLNDCHEYIFHFTKTGNVELDRLIVGVPYQDKSNIRRWKSSRMDKRCRGNTWFITYKTIHDRTQRAHPSSFPIRLPEMCIRLQGIGKTKLVLDPLMGIGSSAIASVRLGVSCIGIELDEQYLNEACRRIRSYLYKP